MGSRGRRLELLTPAVLLIAACSGSASPPPVSPEGAISSVPVEQTAPPPSDPGAPVVAPTADSTPDDVACSFLDAAEIEDIVGNAVEDGVPALGGCEWIADPNDTSVKVTTSDLAQDQCTEAFDAAEDQERLTALPVPSYWWFDRALGGGALTACLDGTQLILHVTAGLDDEIDEDAVREKALELVEIAVDRV